MDVQTVRQRGSTNRRLLQNYKLEKTLGHGSFGKVKLAEHIGTKLKVAIKILSLHKIKMENMEEKVRREIKVCKVLVHPHIVRLYDVLETSTAIYIVMEYVESGELFDYIVQKGRLHEEEALKILQQIISGVEYCHRNMVVHRDLKPENLLLDSKGNIKIADFGFSNIMQDGHLLKTSCGSPNYAAPEVISHRMYAGPEVDVWSCGIVLYTILCGTLPFDDENFSNLSKKIKAGLYTIPSHLSPGARDLLRRIIVVDPLKRITIPEIRQHYWFQTRLPRYLAAPWTGSVQSENERVSTMTQCNEPSHSTVGLRSDHENAGSRPSLPSDRKWALGLQSGGQPREIMEGVLIALGELNICWKKIGHYNMKCIWFHGIYGHPEGIISSPLQGALKFEVQLYKTQESYLLDLLWVAGSQFLFLDLCAAFLARLRVS